MREILFRGKRADNGEWATSPYPYGTMSSDTMIHDFILDTVGEYTGVTDKSGNKVFENDILCVENETCADAYGVICYGEYSNPFNGGKSHIGFYVEWSDKLQYLRQDLVFWCNECEVIGNIFDNPYLVEGVRDND